MTDIVMVPRELLEFLCGDIEYKGNWFGEQPDGPMKRYWWRRHIREALAAAPAPQPASVEGLARMIFEHRSFYGDDPAKPKWTAGGNSDKQGEARQFARAILSRLPAVTPEVVRRVLETAAKQYPASIDIRPPLRDPDYEAIAKAIKAARTEAAGNALRVAADVAQKRQVRASDERNGRNPKAAAIRMREAAKIRDAISGLPVWLAARGEMP